MKQLLPAPYYYVYQADRISHLGYKIGFKNKSYAPFEDNIFLADATQITLNVSFAFCGKRAEPNPQLMTWTGICHLAAPQDAALVLMTPSFEVMEILVFPNMKEYTFCLLEMLQSGKLSKKLRNLRVIAATKFPFINQLI
ncbi:MAG: hypothetical protein EOO89_24115 [Pedobacter sp.]|nr:MAG: hypothetical protein EOO89_24115 [Pedobacter sp.]